MSNELHHFTVGEMQCIVVNEGRGTGGKASVYFANAPQDQVAEALRQHNLDGENMPGYLNVLYVRHGDEQVIFDTGLGPMSDPNMGKLIANLRTAGIAPEDITTVVITHGHGDHIGGLADAEGNLLFPNARCLIWKAEWEHWTNEETLAKMDPQRASNVRAKFGAIRDGVTMIDAEDEILPGIHAIHAPGHTPGHMAILLESSGERLLHIVDAAHQIIQCEHPDWSPMFDWNNTISAPTRRKLFQKAAEENLLTLAYHFPYPGLGHIARQGNAFQWQPLEA